MHISLALCLPAKSAEYGYYPSSTLFVGAGIDASDPTTAHPSCIKADIKPLAGGVDGLRFEAKMIKSRKDLYDSLSISTSVSARYSFFGGSAGLNLDDQYSFSSDELLWIVYGFTDYGRFGILTRPELLSTGHDSPADMIEQRRYSDFTDACGSELVTAERRAVWAAVIYSANGLSESSRHTLEANFSASVGTGLFSADVQAKYKSFIAQAAQLSQVKISAFGIGGGGISDISSLVVDYTDVNKVAEALSRYMKGFNSETAVPISYFTQSMKIVGWKGEQPQASDIASVDAALSEYYDLLQAINSYSARIRIIYNSLDNGLRDYMNDITVASITSDNESLFDLRKSLAALAVKCNTGAQACDSDAQLRKSLADMHVPQFDFMGKPTIANSKAISICNDNRQVINGAISIGKTSSVYETAYILKIPGDWDFISNVSFLANGDMTEAKQATSEEVSESADLANQPKPSSETLRDLAAFRGTDVATTNIAASRWTDKFLTLTVPNSGGISDTVSIKVSDKLGGVSLKTFVLDKPDIRKCVFR